ncbi:hypothetical protein Tdes44962_MAKER09277 [Teratosphaeria destructans]|uniref:Uncharacterized protein n=1 Tax=Teratosphaeria destructans TaxID=418781 RepID=A0A9W7STW9_9PEZI|nr:hypothetical protein Tdes44962_MAKER09277 [Teratosphaeria destructans]
MLPPLATSTLARGEVVTKVWPWLSVLVMTAAGTRVDVVKVLPWESVVTIPVSTLVGADVAKASVV